MLLGLTNNFLRGSMKTRKIIIPAILIPVCETHHIILLIGTLLGSSRLCQRRLHAPQPS